jgi:hypothetical protein
MQGTCPRCGQLRVLAFEGPPLPCGSCGYTDLVASSVPPALVPQAGVQYWVPALGVCVAVSGLVFAWALLATRMGAHAAPFGGGHLHLPQQSRPLSDHGVLKAATPAAEEACTPDAASGRYLCAAR